MNGMNVIYMHTHDSGRYWSPYGHALPTPNIMEFASESTLFRQCFCGAPTCSPSRACLLTGYTPHENGMQGLASRGWQLRDYGRHLQSYLKGFGYHTALCGIQHVAPDFRMIGYDEIVGSQEFSMDETEASMEDWDLSNTDEAVRFLEGRKDGEPFFLSMGWFNTHREYPKASEDFDPGYLHAPDILYDCPENRRDMADYCESVRVVDRCFGKMRDALKRTGLEKNTLVILTTDHGIAWPKMKCTLYDTGIGVALMMAYPGNPMKGKVTDALVSHYDIFPTVCDILDLPRADWLEGFSMKPLLEGKTDRIRDEIFSEVTYHAAYEPKRCVRTDRYKLIRYYDSHLGYVPANIDEAVSKDFLIDNGYPNSSRPREYLFDLWLDAVERENLIGDRNYEEVYRDLSGRLDRWMRETDDPLLVSAPRVAKPRGARVNRLDCMNPRLPEWEAPSPDDWEY